MCPTVAQQQEGVPRAQQGRGPRVGTTSSIRIKALRKPTYCATVNYGELPGALARVHRTCYLLSSIICSCRRVQYYRQTKEFTYINYQC